LFSVNNETAIHTFSYHYRQKFGHVVGKVPLDLRQPCPNRLRGGCIFCRPAGFTPSYLNGTDDIAGQLAGGKTKHLKGRFKKYFAYFQQESCTAQPVESLLPIFRQLLAEHDCVGLILSTRPDCVSDELLMPLADLVRASSKECLFELGLQSVHERSLQFLNRHHSVADFYDAALRLQAAGCFSLGAHLIFGIPGESEEDMLFSLKSVCGMGITHLKLHHLQVIRDTALATLYREGKVDLFTKDAYLTFLLHALPTIPAGVTIHRLWATAHPDLLLAPKWNCLAGTLSAMLQKKMVEQGIWQGQLAENG
jgi:radical SAM protein (TIGR01212 family)